MQGSKLALIVVIGGCFIRILKVSIYISVHMPPNFPARKRPMHSMGCMASPMHRLQNCVERLRKSLTQPLHNVQEVSASGLIWRFCNSPQEAGQDPHVQRLQIRAAVREVQELEGCIRLPRLEALFQRRAEYSLRELLEQGWRRSGRHVSHARQAGYMHKESVRRLSC